MADKTILIIEENTEFREMLRSQFEGDGFKVITAATGGETAKCLQTRTPPDLIILDTDTPNPEDVEFYRNICGTDSRRTYPVFILTGRTNPETLFQGFDVRGFLTKPFDIHQLLGHVRKILNKERPQEAPFVLRYKKSENLAQEESLLKDAILRTEQPSSIAEQKLAMGEGSKEPATAEKSRRDQTGRRRILILENDWNVAEGLRGVFSQLACDLLIVSSLKECSHKALEGSVDLMLFRHFIDGHNTEELAVRLKEVPRLHKIPIILYDDIAAKTPKEKQGEGREAVFMVNAEGKAMLKKVKALLGL